MAKFVVYHIFAVALVVGALLMIASGAAAEEGKEFRYIKTLRQPLCINPGGRKHGDLFTNAPVIVKETRGDWARVAIEGWVKRSSLSGEGKKADIRNVTGVNETGFFIKRFTIRGVRKPGEVPRMYLKLFLENTTKKSVYRWKGLLIAKNKKGEVLFSETLTDERINIPHQGKREVAFFWERNEAPFDPLADAENKESTITLELLNLQLTQD